MRKPFFAVIAAVVFIATLLALQSERPYAAQQPQAGVQKWEYETIMLQTTDVESFGENQLDKLGESGWELCSTVPGETQSFLILKRPLRQ